jgi:hypothetical protein
MPTCDELRSQVLALQPQRDDAADELRSAQGDLAELESDKKHVNPVLIKKAQQRVSTAKARLNELNAQIDALAETMDRQGCFVVQPEEILSIRFQNPQQVPDVDALYAQAVALGSQNPGLDLRDKFPSLNAQQEWKQVLPADLTDTAAHNEDYERDNLAGATGWLLKPEFSGGDVPFDHPFGFDWEFMVALDQPADDPKAFTFLLTPGDQSFDEDGFPEAVEQAGAAANGRGLPVIPRGPDGIPSLLGVEIDAGLVPAQFADFKRGGVEPGDRVAVFGRWIVDCGHQLPIKDENGQDRHPGIKAFRTEIHPPLLMAAARTTSAGNAVPHVLNAPQMTRLLVTSRPYLVGQRFTTDTGTVYDDSAADDGAFVPHMVSEVVKVHETLLGIPTSSIQVEAHPKIKSNPFLGSYEFHLFVKPPAPSPVAQHGPLAVAFQFVVRQGCTVTIKAAPGDTVELVITMDSENYAPHALPARTERTWSREELGKLDPDAADGYLKAEEWGFALHAALGTPLGGVEGAALATAILARGILTDEYDVTGIVSTNLLDTSRPVSALTTAIPDLPGQLAALKQQRDVLANEVRSDEGDLKELESDKKHVNPALIKKAQQKLDADRRALAQLEQQIAVLQASPPQGVIEDDNQPFPVLGWLEVGYLAPGTAQP